MGTWTYRFPRPRLPVSEGGWKVRVTSVLTYVSTETKFDTYSETLQL